MRELLISKKFTDELPDASCFPKEMVTVNFSEGEIAVFAADLWHAGGGSQDVDIRFFAHADCQRGVYKYPHETKNSGSKSSYPREVTKIDSQDQGATYNFNEQQEPISSACYFAYTSTYFNPKYFEFLKEAS